MSANARSDFLKYNDSDGKDDERSNHAKPESSCQSTDLVGSQRGPKSVDDTGQRVQRDEQAIALRDQARGIDHRRDEQPQLNEKRQRVLDVAILDVERCEDHADAKGEHEQQPDQREP